MATIVDRLNVIDDFEDVNLVASVARVGISQPLDAFLLILIQHVRGLQQQLELGQKVGKLLLVGSATDGGSAWALLERQSEPVQIQSPT